MTFALPEIEKASCKSFTACGRVEVDKSPSKSLAERALVALLKRGQSKLFVRLHVEKSGHLHLDVATPEYFPADRKPKVTDTLPQIEALLAQFVGKEIPVRTNALFSIPFEKLPQFGFIKMLSSVESKTAKVSMKLTGGTFSISGAPIQRISWVLKPEEKRIEVRLRSNVKVTLNEAYLEDLFGLLREGLRVFVLNK